MDSTHHNKCYRTNSRIHCSLSIISGNIYCFLHCIGSMYMSPMGLYIDHCSFTITAPLLSLLLYYHCSFTITAPLLSLLLYYHCSFTISDPLLSLVPLQGGVLISSNSLTGSSSNSTTATVEDLPTADYHVFQVGIPTVSDHTCQNIIQLHGLSLLMPRIPSG